MKYHLLPSHQSGFRTGYSTRDVLLHVTDKWLRAKVNILVQYF